MQQINNEYSRFETISHSLQRLIFVRLLQGYRRSSKKLLDALDLLPRGIGIAATVLFLGATITYGLVVSGQGRAVSNNLAAASGFAIKAIKISGQREITEAQILNALAVDADSSLLLYSVHAAKKRVTEIPWVQSVSIQKLFPNTLSVTIKEKEPFAFWQNGEDVFLINDNGEIVTDRIDAHYLNLPLLVGYGAHYRANEILKHVERFPAIKSKVKAYQIISGRRWNLITVDAMTVQLPETGYLKALETIDELNRQSLLLSKDIKVIDMRLHDRMVIRLNENLEESESVNKSASTEASTKKAEL